MLSAQTFGCSSSTDKRTLGSGRCVVMGRARMCICDYVYWMRMCACARARAAPVAMVAGVGVGVSVSVGVSWRGEEAATGEGSRGREGGRRSIG